MIQMRGRCNVTGGFIRTIGSKRQDIQYIQTWRKLIRVVYFKKLLRESQCHSHICMNVINASLPYHSLTSDSCLVLWPNVCAPFRQSLIRTSAVSAESNSLSKDLFRLILQPCRLPVSPPPPLFSLSSVHCYLTC